MGSDCSGDPDTNGLAKIWALFPPDWWVGEDGKFTNPEWAQRALSELLDDCT